MQPHLASLHLGGSTGLFQKAGIVSGGLVNLREFSVPLSLSLWEDLCPSITKVTHTIDAHTDYLYGLCN